MVEVFREVKRVLKADGTLWLNLGDSYYASWPNRQTNLDGYAEGQKIDRRSPYQRTECGLKPKDLVGIPWRVAFALQADGWYLRSDIIWSKPNPMPESVTDRPTKSHEYLFLLSKSERYYYDAAAIAEPSIDPESLRPEGRSKRNQHAFETADPIKGATRLGFSKLEGVQYLTRNKRTVWTVATSPYAEAHFATFPPKLIEPCILAGCPVGGLVLDPFCGSGTTVMVAQQLGRQGIGIELNADYIAMAQERCKQTVLPL
jgi:DNA modification methylase